MSAVETIALSAFVAALLDISATSTVMTAQGVPILERLVLQLSMAETEPRASACSCISQLPG